MQCLSPPSFRAPFLYLSPKAPTIRPPLNLKPAKRFLPIEYNAMCSPRLCVGYPSFWGHHLPLHSYLPGGCQTPASQPVPSAQLKFSLLRPGTFTFSSPSFKTEANAISRTVPSQLCPSLGSKYICFIPFICHLRYLPPSINIHKLVSSPLLYHLLVHILSM